MTRSSLTLVAAMLMGPLFVAPASAEPQAAVERLMAAMNAGDVQTTRALFAPDGGAAYGETAPLKTGSALDAWLSSDIFGLSARFAVESLSTEDGMIVARGRWGNPPIRPFRYAFTVENDRIRSWRVLRP